MFLSKGDSPLGMYTTALFPLRNPFSSSPKAWGAFAAWSQRCSRVQSSLGVQNTELGGNGLGSWSQHKPWHNVWSPRCATHRVNRAAYLHFCPWKLAFTSDSLFWQGFWLVLVLFCPPAFSNIEYFRGNSACFQHLRSVPPKQQTLLRLLKHYFTASLCLSLLFHGVKTGKTAGKKNPWSLNPYWTAIRAFTFFFFLISQVTVLAKK